MASGPQVDLEGPPIEPSRATTPPSGTKRKVSQSTITPPGTPGGIKTKKVKAARARAAKYQNEEVAPGKRESTRTFFQKWSKEGELTAYLTFKDTQHLRRLAMSAYTLKFHEAAFRDRGETQVRKAKVLEYIRDSPSEMSNDVDPALAYPVQEDGTHCVARMALACCQMARTIQKAVFGEILLTQEEQESAQAAYQKMTKRTPPTFPISSVTLKSLGPFTDLGESDLEPYNRCLNLIMYASFSANNSTWKGRYGSSSTQWDAPHPIETGHVPHWLRNCEEKDAESPDEPLTNASNGTILSSREVEVELKYTWKAKPNKELMDRLCEDGLDATMTTKTTIDIHPSATQAEVRDQIRAKLKLDGLGAQISALQTRPQLLNVREQEWAEVQGALWEEGDEKTSFRMILRDRTDDEVLWENEEPPGMTKKIVSSNGKEEIPPEPSRPPEAPIDARDRSGDEAYADAEDDDEGSEKH
jgi:peptidyl-tRNA hydrolase